MQSSSLSLSSCPSKKRQTMVLIVMIIVFELVNCVICNPLSVRRLSSPKITILSHPEHYGYSIDIPANSNLTLRCVGNQRLAWTFPSNYHPAGLQEDYEGVNVTMKCDESMEEYSSGRCVSDLTVKQILFDMTGMFVCQYDENIKESSSNETFISVKHPTDHVHRDSVYIFVNDPSNLAVPYEGSFAFMFVAVFQSQPATIPCKPSISNTKVTLWKTQTKNNVDIEIKPNSSWGISYDPKMGFYFESPRWDSDTHILQCRFEYESHVQTSTVTVHWSVLPDELHPLIDDSSARIIYHNTTFTLRCFVHIEIGVIIVIDWDLPRASNKTDNNKRIVKSDVKTQRTNIENNSYDTVSVNLTVHNALESDSGEYRCNVTDGKGRIFSTVKRINVFDENIIPSIDLSTNMNITQPLTYDVHDKIELTFIAHATPDISRFELSWLHNGRPLDHDSGRIEESIFTDQNTQISLTFRSAKASDNGVYTLVANSPASSTNISAEVIVSGEPEVELDYVRTNYLVNNSFSVLCKAFSYPVGAVWWSWIDCDSSSDCFNGTKLGEEKVFRNDDPRWKNLTECSSDNSEMEFCSNMMESKHPTYLNTTSLMVNRANKTGAFRCSSVNRYDIIKHHQTPFIVTDDVDGFCNIIQTPEEPTTNDNVVLTCRVSIFLYRQVYWKTNQRLVSYQKYDSTSHSLSSTIVINDAKPENSAMFTCETVSRFSEKLDHKDTFLSIKNVSVPVLVESNMKNEVIKKEIHSQFELRCYISGRPKPLLKWFRDNEEIDIKHDSGIRIEDHNQKIIFTRLLEKDSGKYECRAENRAGKIGKSAYLVVNDDDITQLSISQITIYAMFLILAVTILVISVFIGRKLNQERLRKRELELFSQAMFENGQMEMFNPDMPLDEQIDLLPYDSRYEFPKENLKLGRTLGQGAFGRVVKAEAFGLENEQDWKTVAVKMLKERANTDHRKALMAELKILIHLGRHVNIVNLLGAVTRNISKGELLVIVEYCEFGNLRDFLLANRDNFHNEIHPNCASDYQNVPSSKNHLEYQNTWKNENETAFFNHNYVSGTATVALSNSSIKKTQKPLYSSDLICYSFQCSRGMEYLTQRKLIHRDLAARNVLLDSNYIVKICDFGLAKDVYKDDNYVKQNSGPLPIKWMAIESMTDKIFTSKSDVWSFGILLWEIFTLGKNPYPGIEINEEFYQKLKAGYRMEKPEYSSDALYELMLKCWDPSPVARPDFEVLSHLIGEMLPPEKRQQFIDMNSVFEEMNQVLLRNDYIKMAAMTDDNHDDANISDAEMLGNNEDDYLQMHDDRKMFTASNGEVIRMKTLNNNNINNNNPSYDC